MVVVLHHLIATLYLVAGVGAAAGLALSHPWLTRTSVGVLALGALAHGISFALLHTLDPTPALTDTASAVSFMAWVGTLAFLLLLLRARLAGLVVLVAPMAFLGVFFASLRLPSAAPGSADASGSVPHAHVLLASAGLSLLGLAGLAGVLFLLEHRRLKRKRSLSGGPGLPSLEALDRANALALAVGFPLLTLGVITGALWVHSVEGSPWPGSLHETLSLLAWGVYVVLVAQRFGAHQGARQCAASAIGGFAFLFLAVVGVGLFA